LRRVPHGRLDPVNIKLKPAATNLMDSPAGVTMISKGMVQAAEHHTTAG
jgi:hypothetical protein